MSILNTADFSNLRSFHLPKHTQVFEEPTPQSDANKGPEQTGPPEVNVNPVITVNEPDKVSRLPDRFTHVRCIWSCLYSRVCCFSFTSHSFTSSCSFSVNLLQLKVAPSVNRSGRMNLFSLMQSISELDDGDKEQVSGAECQSLFLFEV